jgi:glycosyltransferase involved in cell wall biosynthesis
LRILFIHTKYLQSAGGEDTVVQAESDLMRSKGHEVLVHFFDNAVISGSPGGKLKAGVYAIYNPSSAAEIRNVIAAFKPDIVHVHNFFFAASPSVLREVHALRIPLIATIHNYRLICANALLLRDGKICELCVSHAFPWYGVKYKCYHDSAIQSAAIGAMAAVHKWLGTWQKVVDRYITPSAFARNKLIHSSFNVNANKISVKPNFIPDPGPGSASERKNYFLFVGRLASEKGVNVLLEAWKELGDQKVVIAGSGPESAELMSAYGHLNNISFAGHKNKHEVIGLMKECRALIFPSIWYEGLPMTIIEAFATGTPIIASDLGAMSEMITTGENGLLFQAGNAQSLRQSVHEFNSIVLNGGQTLYNGARKAYVERYHPEKCYDEVMKIYSSVTDLKRVD